MFKRFFVEESGATMVEYGVMVALIAAVCILVVTALGENVRNTFGKVVNAVD